jgi:hypothetical protein
MINKLLSSLTCAGLLVAVNAQSQDLSYLPDPMVLGATADQCENTVERNTTKITNLCNKNVTNQGKLVDYETNLNAKLAQIDLNWASKKDYINTSYRNRRDMLLVRVAEYTALRAEILANCIGGIFGGGGDCTAQAARVAATITKLGLRVEQNDDKWDIALQKNDTKREKDITTAENKYNNSVSKTQSKIDANNNSITTLNNAIVACNAPAVSCPA